MKSPVSVIKKEHLLKGRIFDLERDTLKFPNGYVLALELIKHPGASAVVPLLDENTFLLIRQYRHAIGDYIFEIPAGTLSRGEDHYTCALRELEEETGFKADKLVYLGKIYPLPGYSDETIHLYLAEGLTKTAQRLDGDEILDLRPISVQKTYQMILKGEIVDAKSICGIFKAISHLRGKECCFGE